MEQTLLIRAKFKGGRLGGYPQVKEEAVSLQGSQASKASSHWEGVYLGLEAQSAKNPLGNQEQNIL